MWEAERATEGAAAAALDVEKRQCEIANDVTSLEAAIAERVHTWVRITTQLLRDGFGDVRCLSDITRKHQQ